MQLFDSKHTSTLLENKIKEFVANNREILASKVLKIIQIGENASSQKYISLKKAFCERMGIACSISIIDSHESDETIKEQISKLLDDPCIAGCIIQLPLPRPSLQNLLDLIPVPIDIDLLSTKSHHRFYNNDFSRLPPVVRGVDLFLKHHRISPANLNVCILGFGDLVGKPVSSFLSAKGSQVTVYDNKYYDKDPANNDVGRLMKHANILFKPNYVPGTSLDCNLVITSIGIPNLILSRDIVSGASVIDFGYAVVNSKAVGDISLEQDLSHLNFLSPSPGGMGPLIVRFLVMNFLGI